MIARIWKGAVRQRDGDDYARYMRETGVAAYAATPGNRGVWMLRRDVDDRTEFVMFTLWDSLEAVRAFAADDAPDTRPLHGEPREHSEVASTRAVVVLEPVR